MEFNKIIVVFTAVFLCYLNGAFADKPCAAWPVHGKSVVCVCNATYCDTVSRTSPTAGTFVAYTSSAGGSRFKKTTGNLQPAAKLEPGCGTETLVLYPDKKYQTIEGFGGSATDAAGINWKNLSEPLQELLINSYFSNEGLEYNTIRVPIGGTDFSTHPYAYNDQPENDVKLSNFTLAYEDYQYKIPMIKAGMKVATAPVHVIATTWSPPPWMKTNPVYSGYNRLKTQYYQTYADYHVKFIEKYTGEGIPIWAITTTNEPTNGLTGLCFGINCLGWTSKTMGKWIVNNLGPTIRNSTFKNVKILAGDDQRLTIPYWINLMVREHPDVLKYIDGIAVHYYTDFIAPAALLSQLTKFYPDKFIISTEACQGSMWFEKHHVDLGSWPRAKGYIMDIITDINHGVVGWIDWNMCLNFEGGPTWAKNYVDSPIIVYPNKGVFIKQPMFYAMGHFSKFVPRGSRRIKVAGACSWGNSISRVAFTTPRNTVVVVLYNDGGTRKVNIKLGDKQAEVEMEPQSVTTIELPNSSS
ncbi:lysosomal acid glucosylceramidase-like [Anticarsia gemmatalis]|uniref:lysosomal acid glucosylceramidase-like n=1 Tax=Anticarsia gemmatalis TaxID=129554 RepID=UPI003F75888B